MTAWGNQAASEYSFTWFAIRFKGTKIYLFQSGSRTSTHVSGIQMSQGGYPPRLFPNKRSAQNALTAWLAGKWYYDPMDGGPVAEFDKSRKRELMEIVPLTITFPPGV